MGGKCEGWGGLIFGIIIFVESSWWEMDSGNGIRKKGMDRWIEWLWMGGWVREIDVLSGE